MHWITKMVSLSEKDKLAAIFVLAAGLRLLFVLSLPEKWEFYDTVHYDTAAKSLMAGKGFGPSLHYYDRFSQYCLEPVYPLFMAGAYFFLGEKYQSVRLLQAVLSLLLVWLLYKISRLIKAEGALFAAGIAAVYPFFIYITGLLYSTLLFTVLLTASVYFFLLYAKEQSLKWIAAGYVSLAVAVATIPVIAPAMVLYGGWMVYIMRHNPRRAGAAAAIAASVSVLVLAPWTIRNWKTFGILSPGRACLAETRVFEELNLQLRYEDAFKKPVFTGQKFVVEISGTQNKPIFTYYLDDRRLGALKVIDEEWRWPDRPYWGIILYGGEPLRFSPPLFGNPQNECDLWRCELAKAAELTIKDSEIFLQESEKGWRYAAVGECAVPVTKLTMLYPNDISPKNMQRMAFLIGMDAPSLSADGYMIWLHPHMVADMWKINSGRPERPVKVIELNRIEQPMTLARILSQEPVRFFTRHFFPELLRFWSPFIGRITSAEAKPGRTLQLISLLSFSPLMIFTVFGIKECCMRKKTFLFVLLIPILVMNAAYAVFFAEVRYRIPVDGLLIVFAAVGLTSNYFKRKILRKSC